MCANIKDDQIKQWHPQFVLDDVPDIEPAPLPLPPVVKRFLTARDVLMEVKDKHIDTQVVFDFRFLQCVAVSVVAKVYHLS